MRVAENREPSVSIKRIAGDFGVHRMTLTKWLAHSRAEKTAVDTGAPLLVVEMLRSASCVSATVSSNRKSRCRVVRRRICRKRTCRESGRTSRYMTINRLTPPCLRSAS